MASVREIRDEGLIMQHKWDDNVPIYWQLRDQTVAMILDGTLKPGDPLPSVRSVAADFQLNPLTVSKAYQHLVEEGLVAKRRGMGMFINEDARDKLLASEREKFIRDEWPAIVEKIKRLGLDLETLKKNSDLD